MDPPLVNESSFSLANPSSYTLAAIWPFVGDLPGSGSGLRMDDSGRNLGGFLESSMNRDGSVEESTVTEQSGGGGWKRRKDVSSEDESSRLVSTSSATANQLSNSKGKRTKAVESREENGGIKAEVKSSSADGDKLAEQSPKPSEPQKDYIHVRARRGQATDSHSLAERARREKISERMKILQDLVPGCNKVIGKALVLDEIINYIQSLQRQVEFLSMKLETVNSRMNISPVIEGLTVKNECVVIFLWPELDFDIQDDVETLYRIVNQPYDAAGILYGSQAAKEYSQITQPEWLHMQIGGSFERTS